MLAIKLTTVKVDSIPASPYEPHLFFRGFGTQDSTNYQGNTLLPLLAFLLVNKPALKLLNKSLLTIVNSQDGLQGLTDCFNMYSVST